ncbi:MAG: hypothetical protein ACJA0Z_000618 [Halioglobus sp.]|jgi:hypothetical protein
MGKRQQAQMITTASQNWGKRKQQCSVIGGHDKGFRLM